MKKKEKMLITGIIVVIIISFTIFVVSEVKNYFSDSKNGAILNSDKNAAINYQNMPIIPVESLDYDGFLVFDFTLKETETGATISFIEYNSRVNKIENKALYMYFYQDDKLIYSEEMEINELEPGEEREITLDKIFEHKGEGEVKCVFIYNNYRLAFLNKKEFEAKYGKLGKPFTDEEALKVDNK